jgi:hypothetical protein
MMVEGAGFYVANYFFSISASGLGERSFLNVTPSFVTKTTFSIAYENIFLDLAGFNVEYRPALMAIGEGEGEGVGVVGDGVRDKF